MEKSNETDSINKHTRSFWFSNRFPIPLRKSRNRCTWIWDAEYTFRTDSGAESVGGDILVINLEEVQEPIVETGIELFFNGNNYAEPSEAEETEKIDVQNGLTKIQTKIKCVEKILKKAVIKTYYVNGQIEGLQLYGLNEISEAKALLLKSGDIIMAVNGQSLISKKRAYDIFKKARKQSNMVVELLRDGEAKKLLFDFRGAV